MFPLQRSAATGSTQPGNHPLGKEVVGYAEQANPLGVWGDDGRFNRSGQKLVLFTVNSLLHKSSRDSVHSSEEFFSNIDALLYSKSLPGNPRSISHNSSVNLKPYQPRPTLG